MMPAASFLRGSALLPFQGPGRAMDLGVSPLRISLARTASPSQGCYRALEEFGLPAWPDHPGDAKASGNHKRRYELRLSMRLGDVQSFDSYSCASSLWRGAYLKR
jgi:hypothetical protein